MKQVINLEVQSAQQLKSDVAQFKVQVTTEAGSFFNKEEFPLKLVVKDTHSDTIHWEWELFPNCFTEYYFFENRDLIITTNTGKPVLTHRWDADLYGTTSQNLFDIWCKMNPNSKGVAIGTNDGMTGEWVGPVNKGLLKATLVEASDIQFKDLLKYYKGKKWINCIQSLITTDGNDVVFYEGGNGFTNSLSKNTIEKHINTEQITSRIKSSESINNLIIKSSERGRVKWLHIDVEGMDGELIYAINDDLLPELLLFESLHMENEYYDKLCNYLTNKGYSITKSGWNTICTK